MYSMMILTVSLLILIPSFTANPTKHDCLELKEAVEKVGGKYSYNSPSLLHSSARYKLFLLSDTQASY